MEELDQYPRADSNAVSSLFPYEQPYPQQVALMNALLQGIRPSSNDDDNEDGDDGEAQLQQRRKPHKTRILCLESPTGTGKSLSLACASFSWLDYHQQKQQRRRSQQQQKEVSTPATTTNTTASSSSSIWKSLSEEEQEEETAKLEQQRQEQLSQVLFEIREQYQNNPTLNNPKERRIHVLRQAITQAKVQAKKQQRLLMRENKRRKLQQKQEPLKLQYDTDDDDENDEQKRQRPPQPQSGSPEWLLASQTSSTNKKNEQQRQLPFQIIYAARTHSQLAQFVSEVRKTKGKWSRSAKIVTLGSRSQGLCGYLSSSSQSGRKSLKTETQWTEACNEARQTKSCTYYCKNKSSVATLAIHSLAAPSDIEDWKEFGTQTKTCSYYASRQAVPNADLICLPYQMLVSSKTRESIGLTLHRNQVVLVDEAHNLPQAIASTESCKLSFKTLEDALYQVQTYTTKYIDRLSSRHLRLLGQLKLLVKGFIKSICEPKNKRKNVNDDDNDETTSKKQLWSSSEYLCEYRLENINLFPILSYMKDEQLSRKLLGFLPPSQEDEEKKDDNNNGSSSTFTTKENNGTSETKKKKTVKPTISPMSSIEFLLNTLNYDNADGKLLTVIGQRLEYVVLNPGVHAEDDLFTKPFGKCFLCACSCALLGYLRAQHSSDFFPFLFDGTISAVALVGGTLQPMQVLMQELIPALADDAQLAQDQLQGIHRRTPNGDSPATAAAVAVNSASLSSITMNNRLHWNTSQTLGVFSCGHVVDNSHVLLQAVNRVDGVPMEIKYGTRETPPVCCAIGKTLVLLCHAVPRGGVVVFFPSYNYLNFLVDYWKQSGHWKQLQEANTLVVSEPKNSKDVDKTLTRYSQAASGGDSSKGGQTTKSTTALLLSVVGGKLSEGINFANDMCRCVVVVGLPFADRSDPLLQEKLKLVSNPSQFYRSMCMRAVNQSVGRAIRHAKDYASIVLLDARYSRDEAIARGLPTWLTDSTPEWRLQNGDLNCIVPKVQSFLETMNLK